MRACSASGDTPMKQNGVQEKPFISQSTNHRLYYY